MPAFSFCLALVLIFRVAFFIIPGGLFSCSSFFLADIFPAFHLLAWCFLLGPALALKLGVGFVPVRKPGKLPWKTYSEAYDLEYGSETIEIHQDALTKDDVVIIHDDLLATGGTMSATINLVNKFGAAIEEARREGPKELLYADDLVLMAESGGGGSGKVQGVEEGDGEKRAEDEHGKDKNCDIWRGADDKNGEWEISVRVLWKRGGREFSVVCRM